MSRLIGHDCAVSLLLHLENERALEWRTLIQTCDACGVAILTMDEARHLDPMERAVNTAPAPRLSRTASKIKAGRGAAWEDANSVLRDWGDTC